MDSVRNRKRPVTLEDVARRAGVSRATAARALGGYGVVSPEARERVLAAAEALDYQPNELARSIMTGRSGTLGVIVGDIENPYFGLAVRGIGDLARAHGFNVLLANSGEDVEAEKAAVAVLIGKRVDGLIVSPARLSDAGHLQAVLRSGRPLALLDRTVPGLEADAAVVDDREAAEAATRLLVEAGHQRIAYVTATHADDPAYAGPAQIDLSSVLARIEGFAAASKAAGIAAPERLVRLGATDFEATRRIVAGLLARPDRPTAIFASDSVIALNVFKTVQAMGLAIPRDLSLMTFHDADWTSVTTPPITVVSQPVYELGQEATRMLIRRIQGAAAAPERRVLKTTLIPRASIGPPAAA